MPSCTGTQPSLPPLAAIASARQSVMPTMDNFSLGLQQSKCHD